MSQKLTYDQAAEYLAEAAARGDLGPMEAEWIQRLQEERIPWFRSNPQLNEFLQSLFPGTHAGPWITSKVIPDKVVPYLIEHGEFWVDPIFWQMEPSRCHQNVAALWRDQQIDEVWAGYALTDDGMWRGHSWGLRWAWGGDNNEPRWEVIETTEPRLMYWGIPDPEYVQDPDPEILPFFV